MYLWGFHCLFLISHQPVLEWVVDSLQSMNSTSERLKAVPGIVNAAFHAVNLGSETSFTPFRVMTRSTPTVRDVPLPIFWFRL